MPTMQVVAGPSGSGKTSAFPGESFGCDYFNADAYAAVLNGGSYLGIPKSIRAEVGPICEKFIQDHISAYKNFATETTLRSRIVFDQMKEAHAVGFVVRFIYVCVDGIERSIDRVAVRADLGGHSGSEDTVREIRSKSLSNFPRALDELGKSIDFLNVYDNSVEDAKPTLIASFQGREIKFLAPALPVWLTQALEQTSYPADKLQKYMQQAIPLPEPI